MNMDNRGQLRAVMVIGITPVSGALLYDRLWPAEPGTDCSDGRSCGAGRLCMQSMITGGVLGLESKNGRAVCLATCDSDADCSGQLNRCRSTGVGKMCLKEIDLGAACGGGMVMCKMGLDCVSVGDGPLRCRRRCNRGCNGAECLGLARQGYCALGDEIAP